MTMENGSFRKRFGRSPDVYAEVPGRTELGGNHTDHQHGVVIAAPVDLKIRAWAAPRRDGKICAYSDGYGSFEVDLSGTDPEEAEKGTAAALIRGVAAGFVDEGLRGFDAWITSDIPSGSGLSSSAALEILLGRICCRMTGCEKTGTELAKLGQHAENAYFGKPCGLMDQMACSADGILMIDFADPVHPAAKEIPFRFPDHGYRICILRCGKGHEDMTADYAMITEELGAVCAVFGKNVLREVPEEEFFRRISELRQRCGDRAVLRAMHVYAENRRVREMAEALEKADMTRYLELVRESGRSSWELLQNVTPQGSSLHQEMAFSLAAAEKALKGKGAVRVHGGGFAGTIQAYVPLEEQGRFAKEMDDLLGTGSCIGLDV